VQKEAVIADHGAGYSAHAGLLHLLRQQLENVHGARRLDRLGLGGGLC